jgi:GAF domain-containing protein
MNDREERVLRSLAQLAADLGPALVPTGHEALLESITSAAKTIFDAAACSVALLDEDADELVFYVASGEGAEDVTGMRIPASQGIAGYVLMSGQAMAIEDVRSDPRFATDVAETTGYIPRSILAMPLTTDRDTIGVISVLDRSSTGTRDMELLSLFARQAALAIENSRVFTELGRALFEALASVTDEEDLASVLRQTASDGSSPSPELAELAAHIRDLAALGGEERRAATELVGHFLNYVRSRRRWI